ncbi:sugar kinase [Companilactobacillus suantsaicola]|uniref:Sugar kinase n=1 Tax=Companilactobacillus suantsaicola TaxID=2487723 RepID=A0A4Z0JFY6_9LACO|nr:sugar kinase [Companilactobacillus suantsaicola]TGD21652.1 sugar kinase [Companilactobacillus suantsaicola]
MMKVLTFGEMMLRLKPSESKRILQSDSFEANYGGSEANVAVSLALQGDDASYVSKLPANLLGDAALGTLNRYGVNTGKILRGGPRLGIYFFEKGASIRGTNVVYDRAGSSFAEAKSDEFNWSELLKDVDYFHFSGITAALSKEMQETLLSAVKYCQENNITVVFDTNYRGKMWTPEEAQAFSKKVMPYVNVVLANDEDFEASLNIKAFDGDMKHGIDQVESFKAGMREVTKQYPNCHTVASILRNIQSVEDSQWTALVLRDGIFAQSPVYKMHVYEGVASGDAFGAGLIHGFLHDYDLQTQVNYAMAASVLKLTIAGDLNLVNESEIKSVMQGADAMSR